MNDNIYYYKYKCPVCGGLCEVGFYTEPYVDATFTCNANGNPHDLLINGVDNENMTLDVEDFYPVLLKDFEDYYKNQGREVPDNLPIGCIEF